MQDGGGYREYYKDGKRGASLQGGGTTGGIGIDCEFYESILLPSIVTYGFLGLEPGAAQLVIDPKLPKACPEIGASNVLYHNVKLDIKASEKSIDLHVKDIPLNPIIIILRGNWRRLGTIEKRSTFEISSKGDYRFEKY